MKHFHGIHSPDGASLDRWFDMREYLPSHCYFCDSSGFTVTTIQGALGEQKVELPCFVCRPIARSLAEPTPADDIKTDAPLSNDPVDVARRIVESPSVTESHASCRAALAGLLAAFDSKEPA